MLVIFETAPLVECKLIRNWSAITLRECNYFNFDARYKLFAFWFSKSALFPPDEIDYSSVTVRKWNRQLCFERWSWLLIRDKRKWNRQLCFERSNTEKLKTENNRRIEGSTTKGIFSNHVIITVASNRMPFRASNYKFRIVFKNHSSKINR